MNLLTQSFWRDEAFTGILIRHNPLDIIRLMYHDSTPPLYYLVLWSWSHLFGDSEGALRSLSTAYWLGTAWLMWRIGSELKVPHAWMVGLLTITQPFLVVYAFEARAYEQLLFLTAIDVYLFLIKKRLEILDKTDLKVNLLLVLSLTATLYTHLFGMWVVIILIGWALVARIRWWWLVIPILLFIPWVPSILSFSMNGGALPYILDWYRLGITLVAIGLPFLLPVFLYLPKLWRDDNFVGLTLMWMIPILGAAAYTKLRQQFLFQPKYLIESLAPLILMIGMIIRQRFGFWLVSGIVAVQLCLSVFVFNQRRFPESFGISQLNFIIDNTYKSPYRDLAQYIKSNRKSGDDIINATPLTYFEAHYYDLPSMIYTPSQNQIPTYLGLILIDTADNKHILPEARRYWLIASREGGGRPDYPFPGKLLLSRDFGTLQLDLYAKN
jgi:uncharacterized membrane protein